MERALFALDRCVVCGSLAGMEKSSNGVTCARLACCDDLPMAVHNLQLAEKMFEEKTEDAKDKVRGLKEKVRELNNEIKKLRANERPHLEKFAKLRSLLQEAQGILMP